MRASPRTLIVGTMASVAAESTFVVFARSLDRLFLCVDTVVFLEGPATASISAVAAVAPEVW